MESNRDHIFIMECRNRIEESLGWGTSDGWTVQDFEALSEKIQSATGTYLSVTTLKRIWGKVKYESKPTITTLNALAQFLNFENWRAFRQSQTVEQNSNDKAAYHELDGPHSRTASGNSSHRIKKSIYFPAALVVLLLMVMGLFYFFSPGNYGSAEVSPAKFEFSSKKIISSGVPNSVIFDYDATASAPTDSVSIQQSWDPQLAKNVSRNDRQYTSIYYYPGFFEAKLLVNHEVKKEHKLYITTDGWLPLVEQEEVPIYFMESDAKYDGELSLSLQQLKGKNIQLQPVTPWVDYYNVREFGELTSDNFTFETEVRSDYKEGSAICQHTKITLLTEGSAMTIPLSVKGCISDLKVFFIDHFIDGKKEDLSGLGCDLTDWVKVRCEVIDKKAKIFVNDEPAFEASYHAPATKITGIVFRFQGTGSVKYVKLSELSGQVVYEDDFN